ncbi:MAG: hypothetical protein R2844_15565 [Caldilineales bacterium]
MTSVNYHLEEELRVLRLSDCMRRAELDCLCRKAGIDRRGWTGRQACRLLSMLGLGLVKVGRRLEAMNLSSPAVGELQHNM